MFISHVLDHVLAQKNWLFFLPELPPSVHLSMVRSLEGLRGPKSHRPIDVVPDDPRNGLPAAGLERVTVAWRDRTSKTGQPSGLFRWCFPTEVTWKLDCSADLCAAGSTGVATCGVNGGTCHRDAGR